MLHEIIAEAEKIKDAEKQKKFFIDEIARPGIRDYLRWLISGDGCLAYFRSEGYVLIINRRPANLFSCKTFYTLSVFGGQGEVLILRDESSVLSIFTRDLPVRDLLNAIIAKNKRLK